MRSTGSCPQTTNVLSFIFSYSPQAVHNPHKQPFSTILGRACPSRHRAHMALSHYVCCLSAFQRSSSKAGRGVAFLKLARAQRGRWLVLSEFAKYAFFGLTRQNPVFERSVLKYVSIKNRILTPSGQKSRVCVNALDRLSPRHSTPPSAFSTLSASGSKSATYKAACPQARQAPAAHFRLAAPHGSPANTTPADWWRPALPQWREDYDRPLK